MRLKDLVGKMAIRTAEPFSTEPPSGIVTGFGLFGKPTVFRFNQKYMDEPVKIVNVKEDQVVIEDKRKGYEREPLFISKAITLLLYARKNRDADYFSCNCMQSERVKNFDEYLRIEDCEFSGMPGYAYDCHTLEGKRRGKTVADFIVEEQKDLKPYQPGMFAEESWDRFLGANNRGGWDNTDKKYPQPTEAQLKELENEDFQDGAPVRYVI